MASPSYDAMNSSATLGGIVLMTNNFVLQQLMYSPSSSNIRSLETILDWLDGILSGYREKMSIRFYDPYDDKEISFDDYYSAIKHIRKKIQIYKGRMNDIEERPQLVFWINRWNELLTSCYDSLRLSPERSAGDAEWEPHEVQANNDGEVEKFDTEKWTEKTKISYDNEN